MSLDGNGTSRGGQRSDGSNPSSFIFKVIDYLELRKSYKTSRKGRHLGLTHGLGPRPGLYELSGKLPLGTAHSVPMTLQPPPPKKKILPEKVVSEQSQK